MADKSPTPKQVHPDTEDVENLSKGELIVRLREQDQYIKQLEAKRTKWGKDEDVEAAERLKQQQKEAARRENTLVHRLTIKEQELQDLMNQIAEMKQAHTQGTTQLKLMLLDPAVNIVFQRMTQEMEEAQEKLKQTQNELSAWKFTPDSQTGKRLMARCQMLLQENEDLGKTIASGRTAKLEGEIALQKTLVTEMKNNQSELDEFLGDLEEDVEGMQTMIYVLQQQLREAKDQITTLEEENSQLLAGNSVVSVKTVHKKSDKIEEKIMVKSENISQNESAQTDYVAMETKYSYFENEKTDGDLEAEYNYEGVYENEDKFQVVSESGQCGVYVENGYKQCEEGYETQEIKNDSEIEISQEHETMETDDNQTNNKTERTGQDVHKSTNHHVSNSYVLKKETDIAHSFEVTTAQSQSQITSNTNLKRQQCAKEDKVDSCQNVTLAEADSVASGEAICKNEKNGHISRINKDQTDDLRIPSPKPITLSPVEMTASKSRTSDVDANPNNTVKSTITTNDLSPRQTRISLVQSNIRSLVDSATERVLTENTGANSPVSATAAAKEQGPVLQKFMNGGVTSTVDDIEDL